jgi:hypothetical protein
VNRELRFDFDEDVVVRLAMSLPRTLVLAGTTGLLPAGMPTFYDAALADVRLLATEPGWEPHLVKPFLTPAQFEICAGNPGRIVGLGATFRVQQRVRAYLPSTWYDPGDPVWVWEYGWHQAEVINAEDRWVRVRYLDGFRDRGGNAVKGYRPPNVWPALCDHSAPHRAVLIPPEFAAR